MNTIFSSILKEDIESNIKLNIIVLNLANLFLKDVKQLILKI